jgi:hypothetical protein
MRGVECDRSVRDGTRRFVVGCSEKLTRDMFAEYGPVPIGDYRAADAFEIGSGTVIGRLVSGRLKQDQ